MSLPALLAEPELIQTLIEKGLISRKDFVERDIRVSLAERRNRNVKITISGKRGLFIKQPKANVAVGTIFRESAALSVLAEITDELTQFLPQKLMYDQKLGLLVSALIPSGRSLHEMLMHKQTMPGNYIETAGTALARLHQRHLPTSVKHITQADPPIQWNRPHYSVLRNISPANVRLLEAVQNDRELSDALDDLQSSWRRKSVIHGDAKLDNFVTSSNSVFLVDWELSTAGEPGWDVGTVFSSLLFPWIASMPMAEGTDHDVMANEASLPLQVVQDAASRFWHSYATELGLETDAAFLERAVKYCGARLVQTAYEYMQFANRLTANAIYLLQVAANLIKSPDKGAQLLVGHS